MAEWLRSKFGKGKHNVYDPDAAVYAQGIINSQAPESADIQKARAELDINIHTIVDEGIIAQLDELQVTPEHKYKIYLDREGNYCSKETVGCSEKDITVPPHPVPWALALRVAVSKVSATRFITKQDARIYKNRMRNEFLKIKRGMTQEERFTFVSYVNQIELQCLEAVDDCVDGQKMLALKTSGKHLRVGVQTGAAVGGK
jgi:hypothetical protein